MPKHKLKNVHIRRGKAYSAIVEGPKQGLMQFLIAENDEKKLNIKGKPNTKGMNIAEIQEGEMYFNKIKDLEGYAEKNFKTKLQKTFTTREDSKLKVEIISTDYQFD